MQLAEFVAHKEKFLTHIRVEKNLSPNTYSAYTSDFQQFVQFWQRVQKQEKITLSLRTLLERFFVSLYHKKIDKSSIARKLSCFRSFEKYMRTQGIDLSLKLTRPRLDKKLPVYLTVDELFHLLDTVTIDDMKSAAPYRDKAILELLYATGIRCSELCAITMADIDFTNKTIRIFGKGRKERMVLFGSKAHEKIIQYLENERSTAIDTNEPLFITKKGVAIAPRAIQRIIEQFRHYLKIERAITPHKIRHSFATHLLTQGADLRMVQELLGHATLSSTEIYTHVTPAQLSQLCDTLHPLNTMFKTKK